MFDIIIHFFMRDKVTVTVPDALAYLATVDMRNVSYFSVVCNLGD